MCAPSYPPFRSSVVGLSLAPGCASALAGNALRLGGFGTMGHALDNRSDIAPARELVAPKLQWGQTQTKPSGYGLWWRDVAVHRGGSRIARLAVTAELAF